MKILVVNCGSSSIKYRLFEMPARNVLAKGMVERIGEGDAAMIDEAPGGGQREPLPATDHNAAMAAVMERLSALVVRQAPLPTLWQRGFETQMKQFLGLFSGTEGLLLAILLIGIIAPLGEELFFRGFAYRCFRTRWGPAVGAAASAALFALVHLHPVGLLPIFVVGCALAYLYERTGSLVAPFTLHAANNIAALLVLHFSRGA